MKHCGHHVWCWFTTSNFHSAMSIKLVTFFCLELGSIPLGHVPLMVFHQLFVPRQQWTKHAALDKTWQFQPNMTRDFTEPCLCIAEHTFYIYIWPVVHMGHYKVFQVFIWVITRDVHYRFSGFGNDVRIPCIQDAPIVSWSFSSKGWRISWYFQMQRNQANFPDIHIFLALELEVPPPLPLPTLSLSHRDHHYQPPLSPPPLSQPPRSQPPPLTKTCFARLRNAVFQASTFSTFSFWGKSCTKILFSHLQLSVFFLPGSLARKLHFHIVHVQLLRLFRTKTSFSHFQLSVPAIILGNVWALPRNVSPRKTFFERTNRPAFGRRELCDFLIIVWLSFGLSFGTPGWIKKICKTMILGNPCFQNS